MLKKLFFIVAIVSVFQISITESANVSTMSDFWNNRASFRNPRIVGFRGLHFLNNHFENGLLKTFFIRNKPSYYRFGTHPKDAAPLHETGLATSIDGVNFIDQGSIVAHTAYERSFDSRRARSLTGRLDNTCEGRSAGVLDSANYLTYNSIVNNFPGGRNMAAFHLWIDSTNANGRDRIATIDVYSISRNRILASRQLTRRDFRSTLRYGGNYITETIFNLPFNSIAGDVLEFRVFHHKNAYLCHRLTGVYKGPDLIDDNRMASFPGAWKDGRTWYVAYEAADLGLVEPGKIRYAISTDGRTWRKKKKPLLTRFGSDYSSHLVGTPTLYKENGVWYLFFHGHSNKTGKDVCSIAYGTDIENLKPLETGIMPERSWNNGTVCGKISSILKEGEYYYMVFEGGTFPESGGLWDGRWGVGVARARSILGPWEQYANNPIIGPTRAGLGLDGPELTKFPNGKIYVYYRHGGNDTTRVELVRR